MSASVDVVIQALDALRIEDLDKTSMETVTKIEASLWFWSGTITRYQESRWRKERDCKANRTVLADYPGASWIKSGKYAAQYDLGNGEFSKAGWFCQDCGSRITGDESKGCDHCGYGQKEKSE